MRRQWRTIAIVVTVAVVALSAVAVAYGATRTSKRVGGPKAACGALMNDPQAPKALGDLRTEHQKEMQAWYDQYGSDPSGAEAQAALQKLREEHWNDMRALLKKFGVAVSAGSGPGGGCGGACLGGGRGPTAGGQGAGYGGGMMGGSTY